MSVSISPTSVIKAKLGLDVDGRVQNFFTSACQKRMDKYVPKREGNLRTNIDIQTDRITYKSPYAHAQYVGFTKGPVKRYTTAGTGPYWDSRMKSVEMNELVKEVQDYIDGGK